jgi:glucose/arabinose dehydrogenase
MTKVVRGRLREGALVDQETLFEAPRALYRRGQVHFGSRFAFDGKGHVCFSIGERGQQATLATPFRAGGTTSSSPRSRRKSCAACVVLAGGKATRQEVLFKGIGRVRDVVSGPDGLVYVALSGPDRVARLVPAAP